MALTRTGSKAKQPIMLLDNYLYISHLDEGYKFWVLPACPDSIQDSMQSQFTPTNALGRSAPVYTYSNSGPRSIAISLTFHRDIMDDVNIGVSNSKLGTGEDYVDNLIRAIQSIAVPKYNISNKAVEPPLVAVRFVDQIFIKGVVNSDISIAYNKPILSNNKYANVTIGFTITEVTPYDATTIFKNGSFRGVVKTLKSGMNIMED